MKIDNTGNQYFGAKYINKMNVGKLVNGRYKQVDTSFVKIDKKNIEDMFALQKIANYWEHDKFAGNIYQKACSGCSGDIYALTTQNRNFEQLDSDNILGVCEIAEDEFLGGFLDYLQVNPEHIYSSKPSYKGVGSAILNSLKCLYNKISLTSYYSKSVRNFYKRNEFQEYPEGSCFFTWYKDILDFDFYDRM